MGLTVVIGAGPAGLAAAYELARAGSPAVVLEQDGVVGGLARTVEHNGYRFDIGGHRFFTRAEPVRRIWEDLLGEDFLLRPRLSRIFYEDRFFDYPLRPANALLGLGPVEAARIAASFAAAQLFPSIHERSFEQWVVNRFGRRLYEIFFKSYTEKVWGIPCSEIGAEWAAQRIKNLDLGAAVKNALFGATARRGEVIPTLIEQFHYPRLGPGMMWERCRDRVAEAGIATEVGARVVRVRHDSRRVVAVVVRDAAGREREVGGDGFISSMPLRDLVAALDPPAPRAVCEAAGRLSYRDFLTVVLIVDRAEVFPDNWIYIHSPRVRMGRIQNFKAWSPEMVPDPRTTSLGLEYFVQQGDELWSAHDGSLVELGTRECAMLGLVSPGEVRDGVVVRMPKAYPVYDRDYRAALDAVRAYLATFENLQVIGRNGQHRYNNQDHSMLTGMLAANNVTGAGRDVWGVNVERTYLETGAGERATPWPVAATETEELLRRVFARFDPVAMAGAIGTVTGVGLFLATAILLVKGGERVGPRLALLSNYLLGYDVSWAGALLGMLEAGIMGAAFGWAMASAINLLIRWEEVGLRRRLEMARTMDPFGGDES